MNDSNTYPHGYRRSSSWGRGYDGQRGPAFRLGRWCLHAAAWLASYGGAAAAIGINVGLALTAWCRRLDVDAVPSLILLAAACAAAWYLGLHFRRGAADAEELAEADLGVTCEATYAVRLWGGPLSPFQPCADDERYRLVDEAGRPRDASCDELLQAAGLLEIWRHEHLGQWKLRGAAERRLGRRIDQLDAEIRQAMAKKEHSLGHDPFGLGQRAVDWEGE